MSQYSGTIASTATALNIPPALALAQANAESGQKQFNPDGSLVTSSAGAIGIFQLEPGTASGLGVDPASPTQNIQGGLSYLAQQFQTFGNWFDALAAYNWGPGNVQRAQNSGSPYPASVQQYASSILSNAGISNDATAGASDGSPDDTSDDTGSDNSTSPLGIIAILVAGGIGVFLLSDMLLD